MPSTTVAARRRKDPIEDHVAALEAAAAHVSPAVAQRLAGVIDSAAALLRHVAASREACGLPPTVEDPVALDEAAAILAPGGGTP